MTQPAGHEDASAATDTAHPGAEHPTQIGPYRILRVLGEGGVGLVYLAEQSAPVRRRVALKVIKLGMDTRQVVARFESERQALAVMDHPNIAHVLDAGAAENGRPYFVMEHVHGVPITDYCDTERLSTQARVALFLDVCAALQHAHQKGVVHRDLKPSNILVAVQETRPIVKVIDFGIAKAMGIGLAERTLVTHAGQLLGTPAYMSPEQAEMSGLDVDTRTDIYSLGVVLYELLTGALPVELDHVPDHAVHHALRETDVRPPSARFATLGDARDAIAQHRGTDAKRLGHELRGDLDWITTKAMEKDRTRRYETAEAFAADLRRHLCAQPVLARPRSIGYVFGRFLARHTAGVAAAAIAVAALAAGAGIATVGFVRAKDAERLARAEAQNAHRTSTFLIDMFEVPDPERSEDAVTAREILERGVMLLRAQGAQQPETRAALMATLGTVYRKLARFDEGRRLLEDSLAIRRKLFGDQDARVAESLINLGELYYQAGDLNAAEPLLREALAINEALHVPDSLAVGEAMSDLAVVLASSARQQYAEAESMHRHALEIYRRELGPDDPSVLLIEFNLSMTLFRSRKLGEAADMLTETHAKAQQILGSTHPSTASYALGLGEIFAAQRRGDQAEQLYRSALGAIEAHYGNAHQRFANANRNLGLLLLDRGQYAEAAADLRNALRAYSTTYPQGHTRVARSASDLGLALLLSGEHAEAETQLRAANAMYESLSDKAPGDALTARARFADLLLTEGHYDEALAAAEQVLAATSDDMVVRAYAASVQSASLAALGRRAEAEALAPALRPGLMQPFIVEHLAMARALSLYASWASSDDARALRADLEHMGFQELALP